MSDFVLGVASSVVAALIVYLIARLLAPLLGYWGGYFNLLTSAWRLQRGGLNNIILSRSDYRLLRGGETIANYLGHVNQRLIYIGFWHAKGIEMANIQDTFLKLLERNCSIELVLLSADIDDRTAEIIAKHLGIDVDGLRGRIDSAWRYVRELRRQIPSRYSLRFSLKSHKNAVYASCFIIDQNLSNARILVDTKIFGLGREDGYAMELVPTSEPNNLYERFLRSFEKIADEAEEVREP